MLNKALCSFMEESWPAYAERAAEAYREKSFVAKQGTEKHTKHGISDENHWLIDADESQDFDRLLGNL